MKAVFLDRNTFSEAITLPPPEGIDEWIVYPSTVPEVLVERIGDADIVLTNKVVIDAASLAQCKQLKLIQVTATGTNNIDIPAAQAQGIAVLNVSGYSTTSVAEHAIMLMLALLRGLKPYHHSVCDGTWQRDGRFCLTEPLIDDMEGKVLGIIGVGNTGLRITALAKAFGMMVLWAEHRGKEPRSDSYSNFETVLAESDIISLHCPLTPQTFHLINKQTIEKMHKKPLLLNLARGDIVDSYAVHQALESQQIRGYAGDVFSHEPLKSDDPLFAFCSHPRVLFTPHVAWASVGAQQRLWHIATQQISSFIAQRESL